MVREINSKTKTIHFSDVKRFIKHLNYRVYVIQLAILVLFFVLTSLVFFFHKTELKQLQTNQKLLLNRIEKIEKKIDYRYFNTTHSLEEINDVRINTFNGSLRH